MVNYNSASALRAFLEQNNLGMQKKFGQNFLINPATRQALVDELGAAAGEEVWEIGPGLGAMTALLLDNGSKVKAFEIDAGFIRVLKEMFKDQNNFSLVEGDAMKTWSTQSPARFLLGNLPYNIAAALLADLIEKGRVFSRMVVTVQKEVALRMAAKAGSADYSSFSVLCASIYNVKLLMTIKPPSFYPQPNVDSMGVLLDAKHPEAKLPDAIPKMLYPLVRALFASRRKTIKNNLSVFSASSLSKLSIENILSENGLTGMERAETLELDQFISLAKSFEMHLKI
ncbi:MAG: 16S rRNA (adenine(1518)-N(6)/adenine(1519)-N(6))-dimethyltransferase RsmA [Treponema sp.]|jgi:16S rRNA (adenine1518-N6/adenine1519-N6)-dimethyltransferase|nr:16S rRNA (adenine(1518)-N(6)/adenine(1519)-N(6))-dimethyltransferase RsmA [Treponema sp.]